MDNNREYVAARTQGGVLYESTGEYVLPDYNGDIKKILYTDARVIPSASFQSGDSIEYSGIVAYGVIYLDSEDMVSHAEFTTDFEGTVRCGAENLLEFDIDTVMQGFTARPVGPRKLSARATLISTLYMMENATLSSGNYPEGYEPEARMGKIKVRSALVDKTGEREYAEELARLDGAMQDEVEILFTNCKVRGNGIVLSEGGAEYKGELDVIALVRQGDSVPFTVEKKIPFSEMFLSGDEKHQSLKDVRMCPNLNVTSVKCTVNADDDGVSITASVITEGKMRVLGNEELNVMLDGYLTECESENSYDCIDYTEQMPYEEINVKAGDTFSRASLGLDNTRNILLPSAEVKISDVRLDSGIEIIGEVRFCGIACEINELGDTVYSQLKIAVPFKEYVNNSSKYPAKTHLEYTANLANLYIELDNDSIRPMAEIIINLTPLCDKHECYVSDINVTGEEIERDDSIVTVYYPRENETLFDISKKYRVKALRVASVNALTESVFAKSDEPICSLGVNKIIIR